MKASVAWQEILGFGRVGNPKLGLACRKSKLGRRDADDRIRAPIQQQRLTQDVGIPAKAALP